MDRRLKLRRPSRQSPRCPLRGYRRPNRLRRPSRLSEEAGKRYLAFLKENAAAAAELLIREDDPEGLSFLASRGAFTPAEFGSAAEQASRLERARGLGVLLHERQSRFPKKNKTFDL